MKLKLANFSQAQVHLNELPKQSTLIAVDFESGQKHVNAAWLTRDALDLCSKRSHWAEQQQVRNEIPGFCLRVRD